MILVDGLQEGVRNSLFGGFWRCIWQLRRCCLNGLWKILCSLPRHLLSPVALPRSVTLDFYPCPVGIDTSFLVVSRLPSCVIRPASRAQLPRELGKWSDMFRAAQQNQILNNDTSGTCQVDYPLRLGQYCWYLRFILSNNNDQPKSNSVHKSCACYTPTQTIMHVRHFVGASYVSAVIAQSLFINSLPEYSVLPACAERPLSTIVRDMRYGCGDGKQTTSYSCFCTDS